MATGKYHNLWVIPARSGPADKTDNIIEIMEEQCQYLNDSTGGKVSAKFSKMVLTGIATPLSSVITIAKDSLKNSDWRTDDDATDGLNDADTFYSNERYCFDIYNSSYKFRLFEMEYGPMYPVFMFVDEDVMQDTADERARAGLRNYSEDEETELRLSSDEKLLTALGILFNSKKVRYLLYRMIQMEEKTAAGQ